VSLRVAHLSNSFAILAMALMMGIWIPRATAQLTSGTVSGTVVDPAKSVIAGAVVGLVSETRGTRLTNEVTNAQGEFVFAGLTPDTYTLEISQKGFKALRRPGVDVAPGDRVALGAITLAIGAVNETVTVTGEAPLLQTESGETSFTITPTEVQNVPFSNRVWTNLTALEPGVASGTGYRIGDMQAYESGNTNVMLDGVSAMDTGENAGILAVNTESIAEVKILVSNYQAEYGRSSGSQMTAVTKSGTNQFHGTGFALAQQSGWNANGMLNNLNGVPRAFLSEKQVGFSVGGPIGKPNHHNNKLFFFFADEFDPLSQAGKVNFYRVPTALERQGNFSQSTDNNGNPYPYIKNPSSTNPCSSSNTSGCFDYGGVLGNIPPSDLYSYGLTILNLYPMPNVTTPGLPYNYEVPFPSQSVMSQAPDMKFDYQPTSKLRASFKLDLWHQPNTVVAGSIPGLFDSQQYKSWFYVWASSVIYTINPTTILSATFGANRNDFAGCVLSDGNAAPTFCTSGIPVDKQASLAGAGLTGLPEIYPNSGVLPTSTYAYQALQALKPPIWNGTQLQLVPSFSWGGRVADAPPNFPFPSYLNTNQTHDLNVTLTKIIGTHTLKAGFYWTHSYKAQQAGQNGNVWQGSISFANDTNNPLDTSFGFANAAVGVFDSYTQQSQYVEGDFVYNNYEGFVQDTWKIKPRLTLDYGVRFVHMSPQYDEGGHDVNFVANSWNLANAPVFYRAVCAAGAAAPCTGSNRQAFNPLTGQSLGPNTASAIGTLVSGSGSLTDGLALAGQGGVPKEDYFWPVLEPAPRLGIAWEPTSSHRIVLRGGVGMFYDRPAGNTIFSDVANPPVAYAPTLYYGTLQTLNSPGLSTLGASSLNLYQLNSGYSTVVSWSGGAQVTLPQDTILNVSYNGGHAYNIPEAVNINAVDFGSAFLPQNQDPTASSSLAGGAAVSANQMRGYRGFGSMTDMLPRGYSNSDFLIIGVQRRFTRGLAFGLNDSWLLHQAQPAGARLQHAADGTWSYRSDQAEANQLYGDYVPTAHTFKGDVVYALPGVKGADGFAGQVAKLATNGWQLSGIWSANTGTAYAIGTSFQDGASTTTDITGSGDYGGNVSLIGNPGSGCSGNLYQQFNTAAFAPPAVGSVGLSSPQYPYIRGCFFQDLDLSLQRQIRIKERVSLSVRLDAFNAMNQDHITGRNTTMQVTSPTNATIVNLPLANGALVSSRDQPKDAGFGMANAFQSPRSLQIWARIVF